MTVRPSKKIEKSLKKNGFVKLASHHKRYFYKKINGGDTLIHTFISHGTKDYGDRLLSALADQLKLNKEELLRFIDGKMTQAVFQRA